MIMELARVGNANWDLYVDDNGRFHAVAKPGTGASDSPFGSRDHVLKLMRDYPDHDYFTGWTEAGREALAGAFSRWFKPVSIHTAGV